VRYKMPGLASGAAVLFAALAAAAEPAPEMTVSEWADANRVVSAESGSPQPGPWRTSRAPYVQEVQDCLHPDHPARAVVFMASAQVAKSEIPVNWFGFIVDRAPGSALFVLPSLDEATKFNRTKLQPTIDASPRIRHRVRPENSRDEAASTTSFKRFAGGFAQIVTASSSKGLQAISVRYLVMDEVSEYPHDVDGRGDPIDQARARQLAYGDLAKEYAASTPGNVGSCRISAMYEAGDRRRFYVPCPHCNEYQRLEYKHMSRDEATGRGVFACRGCGVLLDEVDKPAMLAGGRWVPTWRPNEGEVVPSTIDPASIDRYAIAPCTGICRDRQPSYHLWAAYSPFLTWTEILRRADEAETSPLKLKAFAQQILGEPWDAQHDAPDYEKIYARVEDREPGVVPPWAPLVTGAADVQKDRIEWALYAWGPGARGALVDRGVISGDTTTPAPWREFGDVVGRLWPTASGDMLPADLWGVDSGYLSPIVYEFVRGRPNVYALDGVGGEHRPPLGTARKVTTKNGAGVVIGSVLLHPVGTHGLKSVIMQGLRSLIDGPDQNGRWPAGTIHLPRGIVDEAYVKQLCSESLVEVRKRDGRIAREWQVVSGRRNEALDIAVYARALAWRCGIDRMTDTQWRDLAAQRGGSLPEQSDLFEPSVAAASAPRMARSRRIVSSSYMS